MMHLTDKFHHEALTLRRVFGCLCVCFPFKKQCIEVWLQSGILLGIFRVIHRGSIYNKYEYISIQGVVQEKFSLTSRKFDIESERGEVLYQVEVSLGSTLCMPKEFHFRVV